MNLDGLIRALDNLQGKQIVVGFPKGDETRYPEPPPKPGDENKKKKLMPTVEQVARWNEKGTKTKQGTQHIPARPFLRTAEIKNKENIKKLVSLAFDIRHLGDPDFLHKIGFKMIKMVKDSIENGDWVPNKRSTKISKMKDATRKLLRKTDAKSMAKVAEELENQRPLIKSGLMLRSVQYEIRNS